jgi:O-methyltransferase
MASNWVDERSMVTLALRASSGILAAIIGVVDAIGPGHRAMVLRTYETSG